MNKRIFALTLALLTSTQLMAAENKAGVFLEPMLTYETGEADVKVPAFGTTESEISGPGVGARLGFHLAETFFLGIDGRYSILSYENDDTNIDTDATSYNLGPVAGIQMPTDIGLRLWVGLIMMGGMDVEKDNGLDLKFKDASGYRIGGGIKVSTVSLNLEYQEIEYDETELEDAGAFSGSSRDFSQDASALVFSVSFPFSV